MAKTPENHKGSRRLKGYDYTSPGAYFVTLVTWHREEVFGRVVSGEMILNDLGQIIQEEWVKTTQIRQKVGLDEFVIMPNHLHGIIWITDSHSDNVATHSRASLTIPSQPNPPLHRPARSLGSIIAGFKSAATKRGNQHRNLPGYPLWQRNYYEHIIRNEKSLNAIRDYIRANPQRWQEDQDKLI